MKALFIDDHIVEEIDNLFRKLRQPRQRPPGTLHRQSYHRRVLWCSPRLRFEPRICRLYVFRSGAIGLAGPRN